VFVRLTYAREGVITITQANRLVAASTATETTRAIGIARASHQVSVELFRKSECAFTARLN
jgi:hypothetical protein